MPLQRNAIQVSAITLDLDDTLWPFAPIGMRVEQVLHDWLATHCPRTAERFPAPRMRDLRDQEEPPSDLSYYGLVDMADSFQDYCNGGCTTGTSNASPPMTRCFVPPPEPKVARTL